MDGSVWSRAVWSGAVGITLRQLDQQTDKSPVMNVEVLMKEIDHLRFIDTHRHFVYPIHLRSFFSLSSTYSTNTS